MVSKLAGFLSSFSAFNRVSLWFWEGWWTLNKIPLNYSHFNMFFIHKNVKAVGKTKHKQNADGHRNRLLWFIFLNIGLFITILNHFFHSWVAFFTKVRNFASCEQKIHGIRFPAVSKFQNISFCPCLITSSSAWSLSISLTEILKEKQTKNAQWQDSTKVILVRHLNGKPVISPYSSQNVTLTQNTI